ncbi:MAG: GTP 3',8-cyclase MoaA [Nitrososphaerota archaeon]
MRRPLADGLGRIARKLRLSVTDRCNLRCSFCMPSQPVWLPHSEILTFEEIVRVASVLAAMGVDTVRLTGGEPLMRRDLPKLVNLLRCVEGVGSISLTSNGYLMGEMAKPLREAGLHSVTISLHSLKPERFEAIVGRKDVFSRVLEGIRRSVEAGLNPVKINCVVTRGCNDDEILDFVGLARESGLVVRFIEYMPFDGRRMWRPDLVVSGDEIIERIGRAYRLEKMPREPGSTASSYRFKDGSPGEINIITSMTQPFCGDCDRIRMTADGKIVPCLFSRDEYDIKPLLRGGASDEMLENFIRDVFKLKSPGVEFMLKNSLMAQHVRPMYTIGG